MNHTKLTSALQMLTLRIAKYKISTKSHLVLRLCFSQQPNSTTTQNKRATLIQIIGHAIL